MNPRSNDNNNLEIIMDDFLKSYVTKYDRWRQEGSFSFSSKIIPVNESISASQWILPSDQVLQILKDAESFALTDCICRIHYSRCENPIESVSFSTNEAIKLLNTTRHAGFHLPMRRKFSKRRTSVVLSN